jgi:triacylglycerol lipase
VYSPNTAGKYAVVAVCPGFSSTQSSIAAISRRLATHGFVVVTINTNSVYDYPPSRANQLLAALRTVTALTTGPVTGKMDLSRQGVEGVLVELRLNRFRVTELDKQGRYTAS